MNVLKGAMMNRTNTSSPLVVVIGCGEGTGNLSMMLLARAGFRVRGFRVPTAAASFIAGTPTDIVIAASDEQTPDEISAEIARLAEETAWALGPSCPPFVLMSRFPDSLARNEKRRFACVVRDGQSALEAAVSFVGGHRLPN